VEPDNAVVIDGRWFVHSYHLILLPSYLPWMRWIDFANFSCHLPILIWKNFCGTVVM
jgi:hypothetical protein